MAAERSRGVSEAEGLVKAVNDFLTGLEKTGNEAVLGIMKDETRGKMTDEAIARGKALVQGGRAALADSATGKADMPILTNGVLAAMGACHEKLGYLAVHVRGHLHENADGLDAASVKKLLGGFNQLIDGSAGQASMPARLLALIETARKSPAESPLADLIAKAGIGPKDLDAAEKVATAAVQKDSTQEAQKGSKVTRVAAKDKIAQSLQGWYSRWSGVARHVLTADQQKAVGLSGAPKGGRPKKPAPPPAPVGKA